MISAITVILSACGNSQPKPTQQEYIQQVNQWHQERIASLNEEDSWLSLAGLYKLEAGVNTIGADSANAIVFPPEAAPEIGTVTIADSTITFEAHPEADISRNGTSVSRQTLQTDAQGSPTILRQGPFLWYVIERRGDYYIRLKDTNHPNFAAFNGIDRFPVKPKWRVKATFHPFEQPKAVTFPDVLNIGLQDSLYGTLSFTIGGTKYSLAPLGNPGNDDEFFIIFGDQTNGESTYSGGRYIYAPTPDADGTTYIDFNKAYNPPCVFTHFATCPLPPPQNRLDLKITAGEKMYKKAVAHHRGS